MLRKGVRTNQTDLRRLFDTLKSLRNQRTAITELPTPRTRANEGTRTTVLEGDKKEWDSIEAMEAADVIDDNEPRIRVFRQTIKPPELLKQPLESLSETPILDAATGLNKSVSSAVSLTKVELHYLRKLTNALNFLAHSPISVMKEIFYWLERFRPNPKVLQLLTPHAWSLLWALETSQIPTFRSKLIGDMMVSAGVELNEDQNIAYIGGLYWNGASKEALTRWMHGTKRWRGSAKHWNLGIRMFSLNQEPYVAKYWLGQMITALGQAEPKSFIPVIMSFNHLYHPKRAWETYKEMRGWMKRTNTKLTISQYDTICMSFLDSGQQRYGLDVYKHMIFSVPKALERMQTDIYENLSSAVVGAQETINSPKKLANLSLESLRDLPPKIQDKYFYGSWLKNSIRMGRTDLAWYLVREVMIERDFLPDSTHYNCILQGFLDEKNVEMAEQIAEEMIKSRFHQLEMDKEKKEWKDWTSKAASTVEIDPAISTPTKGTLTPSTTPPATIQTFSLLINYYSRRNRMEKVVAYTSTMSSCQISPNSYIFNHLLYSLLRVHDIPRLMRTYLMILSSADVKPDMETWNIMWMTTWKRYTQRHRRFDELLSPRALFADMVKRLSRKQIKGDEEKEKMKNMWHTVMKSFMLSRDFPGALIALHVGIKLWDMKVDDTVVREIVFGTMRAGSWDPDREERPRIHPEMIDGWVERLRSQARYFLRHRRRRGDRKTVGLWRSVKDPEGLLEGLTSLLRDKLGDEAKVKEISERAKVEMGVEGLKID
jgi:pentatricopeptide repeat protein